MSLDLWYVLFGLVLACQIGAALFFVFWAAGILPKDTKKKYTWKQRSIALFLPSRTWSSMISSEDLPYFVRGRKGFVRIYMFFIVTVIVQIALTTIV